MEFYNIIDKQGRFVGLKITNNGKSLQTDTHTVSYIYSRQELKEGLGCIMGLEKDVVNGDN